MINENKIHFSGLNGLRAIAAMLVVLSHIDQFSYLFGLEIVGFCRSGIASDGVTLFFVLSGFLITFLLLAEKSITSNINIRNFYVRRVLRIWPLYYTVIIVTCFLMLFMPTIEYDKKTLIPAVSLCALLMANLSYVLYFFTVLAPLWSVGVEEQFYLIWPWIVKKSKNIPVFLFVFICVYVVSVWSLRLFTKGIWYEVFRLSSFDCMAFGAIGAWMVFYKSKYLHFIYHPLVQVFTLLLIFVSEFSYHVVHIPGPVRSEYFGLLFLVVILNVSTNKKTILSLENKVLNYLGKISYGIYMYHMLVISILGFLLHPYFSRIAVTDSYALMYGVVVLFTVAISSMSYFFYESRFLELKDRYAVVKSSNSEE